ncbi:MAG: sugar phosphate isomerase/epimerase [Methanosarcinales archaeon]|nr:sugar phosphate isomerase/epimerase [Methanosarcinales archaeon]
MIGISSYAFHNLPLSAALENIESISKCAEIYSEGLHDIFRHTQTPLSYDLKYSVHAPTTDLNISSIREPIRQASLELVRQAVDMCTRIDAGMLVVHPGYFSYSYDLPVARAALNRSIREFADISGDTGVQICIENMPNWECFLFRQPDIDLDGTGLVLDTGHANTTGTLNEFVKHDIAHFHLHDNHGDKDEHMWIGGGNIDFSSLHELLKKSRGIKVLEHRNGEYIKKSMAALKKMGIK